MKVIGIVGGISWISTIDYYRYINEGINRVLGGNEFAECMIYSVNFGEIIRHNERQDFEGTYGIMLNACKRLAGAGAAAIVLGANTMHMFAERLQAELEIPLIHITTATAKAIHAAGLKKVALLGTMLTMEMDFFKDKLLAVGIQPLIPEEADRAFVHEKIFSELGKGIIKADTKAGYLEIIGRLLDRGAEGVIAGCTEIPLLIQPEDISVPFFDTTKIHAAAAVSFALDKAL